MKPLLALIIFADGAAAFLGAIVVSRMRTATDKRPMLSVVLMIGLFGYSGARFWSAWNTGAHGREVLECVASLSPTYLWHSYGALTLQATTAWAATIYLILMLMNGHAEKAKARIASVMRLFRRKK